LLIKLQENFKNRNFVFVKKTIAILLTFVFLIGNLQLTHAAHHCGGLEVKSVISLGHEDLHCGMEKLISLCETAIDHSSSINNKDCCENTFDTFQVISEFHSSYKTEFQFHPFQIAEISDLYQITNKIDANDFPKHFTPPFPKKDKQILFQTFLI
jgi:hypothetical protein